MISKGRINRRDILNLSAMTVGAVAMGDLLAACGLGGSNVGTSASGGVIRIGYVSPLTGPAAGFGEPDPYVIGLARKAFQSGLDIGGKHYSVEIISKDSQAPPSVSSQVANDLISSSKVDLMLATSTPESVNPVSDSAVAAGVPCISTVVPWEAWSFGRCS